MKKLLLIIPFLLLHFIAFSQWRKVEKLEKDNTPNVKLAYWGNSNFRDPGLAIGAEFMLKRKSVTIKNFERTKENYLVVNFLVFDEADLQRGVGLNAAWLKRTTYQHSGIFTEFNLGAGYVRDATIRPTTYLKNADGSETTKVADKNLVLVTLAVGLGYDFMPKFEKPIKAYVQLGVAPMYGSSAVLQFNRPKLEIGIVTSLSIFKKK